MGYGAYMTVKNNRPTNIRTLISEVECMYDHGDEGSNLALFNGAVISGNSQLPGSGGQYIEAKASGTCFFLPSMFNLIIEDATNDKLIGSVAFADRSKQWEYHNTNEETVSVFVESTDTQGEIIVTVKAL